MSAANAQALTDLRDIHLPDAVALWPLAAGWWLMIALILALALGVYLFLRARRRSLRRAALRELEGVEKSFLANGDVSGFALGLATLLRRVAITRFPRRDVASLHGADWSGFLLRTSGDRGLMEGMVRDLAVAVYAGRSAAPDRSRVETWIPAARHWIGRNT